jgi:hypothetical protein
LFPSFFLFFISYFICIHLFIGLDCI